MPSRTEAHLVAVILDTANRRAALIADRLQLALVVILLLVASFSIAISQIALGCLLGVTAYRWMFLKQRPVAIGLEWPALVLAAWALLMIPFSTDPGQSLLFYRRFYLLTALWAVAGVVTSEQRRQWLLLAVLVGAVTISLIGSVRAYLNSGGLFIDRLGEMSNPMTSGALLMIVTLLGGGFVLAKGSPRRLRMMVLVALLPVLLALAQTFTRGAWLGTVFGCGALLLAARPRWFVAGSLLAVVAVLLLPGLLERSVSEGQAHRFTLSYVLGGRSTAERVEMWQGGWKMVQRHPLTGVGDRDLTTIAPDYYRGPDTEYYGHLHSNPVMFAVIWGVPGFLAAMIFLVAQLWLLLRRWRRCRGESAKAPPFVSGWVLGAIGVWTGFFFAGLTEWTFGDAETMMLYLAILGVALAPRDTAPGMPDATDNDGGSAHGDAHA